jgi:hypothetical protein
MMMAKKRLRGGLVVWVEWCLKMSCSVVVRNGDCRKKKTERWVGSVGGVLVEDEHAVLW